MASWGFNGCTTDQGTVQNDSETKGNHPVNGSRSLSQVQPPSQFSDLELRNRGGLGPQGKDGATPQQTDTEMTPVPPKGTSGSALVTPHGGGGTTRRVEVTRHRVNLTLM